MSSPVRSDTGDEASSISPADNAADGTETQRQEGLLEDEPSRRIPSPAVQTSGTRMDPKVGHSSPNSQVKPAAKDSFTTSEASQVKPPAEEAASDIPLHPSFILDDIWKHDLSSIDLPEYVSAHTTTMSFPEKVRNTLHCAWDGATKSHM